MRSKETWYLLLKGSVTFWFGCCVICFILTVTCNVSVSRWTVAFAQRPSIYRCHCSFRLCWALNQHAVVAYAACNIGACSCMDCNFGEMLLFIGFYVNFMWIKLSQLLMFSLACCNDNFNIFYNLVKMYKHHIRVRSACSCWYCTQLCLWWREKKKGGKF